MAAASPAPAEAESDDEREPADLSVPPVGDLDARFFAESTSEAWLAHELELRHPQFLRKMTANVALRRARLARYVVGVVGVAVALCLAALVIPLGLWLAHGGIERALLVAPVLLILIIELVNSAIEATVDRIGYERHALAGLAKDLGSAAVFMSFVLLGTVWFLVLLDH